MSAPTPAHSGHKQATPAVIGSGANHGPPEPDSRFPNARCVPMEPLGSQNPASTPAFLQPPGSETTSQVRHDRRQGNMSTSRGGKHRHRGPSLSGKGPAAAATEQGRKLAPRGSFPGPELQRRKAAHLWGRLLHPAWDASRPLKGWGGRPGRARRCPAPAPPPWASALETPAGQ